VRQGHKALLVRKVCRVLWDQLEQLDHLDRREQLETRVRQDQLVQQALPDQWVRLVHKDHLEF